MSTKNKNQRPHLPSQGPPQKKPRKSNDPFSARKSSTRDPQQWRKAVRTNNENSIPVIATDTARTKRAATGGLQKKHRSMVRPRLMKSRLSDAFSKLNVVEAEQKDLGSDSKTVVIARGESNYPAGLDAEAKVKIENASETDLYDNSVIDDDGNGNFKNGSDDGDVGYDGDGGDTQGIVAQAIIAQDSAAQDTVAAQTQTQTHKTPEATAPSKKDLVSLAHRTMRGLAISRDADITRRILVYGDARKSTFGLFDTPKRPSAKRPSKEVIAWPAVDIARYKRLIEAEFYPCMGIDPLRACEQRYEYIELEEPGAEFDAMQIERASGDIGASGLADEDIISDSTKNGGIGLLIRRSGQDGQGEDGDKIHITTGLHLRHPELLAPWYKQPTAPSEIRQKSSGSCDPSDLLKPLVDITRAQVIHQVRRAQEPSSSHVPLSELVSQTVAQEAAHGVIRTFDRLADAIQSGITDRSTFMEAGTARCGWISILKSALAAGMPPEVVARSYHRLVKLCDVPSSEMEKEMVGRLRSSKFLKTRKLPEK